MNLKESVKYVAINCVSLLMKVLHRLIVPVNNRLVFASYEGDQYSCNPKYITEYLLEKYSNTYEIIWLLKDPENYKFLNDKGIKVVKYNYINRIRYELTSKVNIINTGCAFQCVASTDDQLHINTWHGGGYYKLTTASEKGRDDFYKKCFARASKNTSYFLSTNKYFTDYEIRRDFYYKGEVLNIGSPRNDIFFHCDYGNTRKKVCAYFGLDETVKLLMYAPTFRDKNTIIKIPDFEKLRAAVVECFGGKWIILTRMHRMTDMNINVTNIINANYSPDAPDMQELLMACDMLISDYSSCIWDYSFTYRPCFLFTPDLEEYTRDRGFGIDIYEWGFPVCKTEDELFDAVKTFDPDAFRLAMEKHHNDLGSFENGNASEIMGDLIYNFCFPKTQER